MRINFRSKEDNRSISLSKCQPSETLFRKKTLHSFGGFVDFISHYLKGSIFWFGTGSIAFHSVFNPVYPFVKYPYHYSNQDQGHQDDQRDGNFVTCYFIFQHCPGFFSPVNLNCYESGNQK